MLSRCTPLRLAALLTVLLLAWTQPAWTHPLAPTLLQIEAADNGLVEVTWKTSRLVPAGSRVTPRLPDHCLNRSAPAVEETATYTLLRWQVDCGTIGLQGQRIAVDGLGEAGLNTLVRLIDDAQGTRTWLLKDSEPSFEVAAPPSRAEVALDYGRLGVSHLLFGPDHVLLVVALMMIIGNTRSLLLTITAFTLGHSLTLSLATLGIVDLPTRPIEVAIAASIMLVAASIPAHGGDAPRAAARAPWVMALIFGLLHGFGFAGALADIGLPAKEIPLALFSFNVGIELGQLVIVLLGWWLLRWWCQRSSGGRAALTWAIGGLAGFWTLERLLMMSPGG